MNWENKGLCCLFTPRIWMHWHW